MGTYNFETTIKELSECFKLGIKAGEAELAKDIKLKMDEVIEYSTGIKA